MKPFILFLGILVLPCLTHSQTDYRPYRLPEHLLKLQPIHSQSIVQDRINENLRDLSLGSATIKENFAAAQAKATEDLHASGLVYNDFEEIETYLNQILKRLFLKYLCMKWPLRPTFFTNLQ